MTDTTTREESPSGPEPEPTPSWTARLAQALDRPLASYHLVVGVTALLLLLGLVMVFSASSVFAQEQTDSSYSLFVTHAVLMLVGLPVVLIASRISPRTWRRLAYPALLGSVGLLVLVQIPGIGVEVNGNRNWIDFGGPFRLQPSEAAKFALILFGADLLTRKARLLGQWRHLLVPLLPIGGILIGLILVGHDLGTAMILIAIVMALLWVVGAPLRLFAAATVGVGLLFVSFVATSPTRLARVTTFMDPFASLQGSGFQGGHSQLALATGGWWGLGLGASRQKWGTLPEAHTDFIFAIIGEELGLVGTLAVLTLFGRARLCRAAHRRAGDRLVHPARGGRGHRLDRRAGGGQRRRGDRPAADHRHPAPARLVRRFGPALHHAGRRHALVVRPPRAQAPLRRWRPGGGPACSACSCRSDPAEVTHP